MLVATTENVAGRAVLEAGARLMLLWGVGFWRRPDKPALPTTDHGRAIISSAAIG